ncbi:hypothetical protein ZWY2020_052008, partial [Hordeum vulgare]
PAHRTKVVLRRLPPAIAQQAVVDQVDARFAGRYTGPFPPSNASQRIIDIRLYLNFKSPEDVVEFAEFFNGHVFVNEKVSAQFKALVEYTITTGSKSNIKKDARQGTITKDPEYLEFLELISKPTEHLPSAEIQLERKEAERAAAGKEPPVITPLMVYVKSANISHTAEVCSSRLSRKVAGVVTSSSSPSKGLLKGRASTSAYVVRDNAKEKPTYILAPKRDDHTQRENHCWNFRCYKRRPSGSAQVIGGKRDKIVLLKGRRAQPMTVCADRNTPPSTSRQDQRNEASGRIIKTILSNKEGRHAIASQHEQEGHIISAEKDKRPPRAPNSRSTAKDQIVENAEKNHYDDKHNHVHGSGPIGEKIERHARNRDRPDRGVWAPRRYDKSASGGGAQASSSEFPLMQSHSMDNVSQQVDGHGERKIDTRGPGGRGGLVENETGTPTAVVHTWAKEMEIPPIASDGKQVWVQKSSSGS